MQPPANNNTKIRPKRSRGILKTFIFFAWVIALFLLFSNRQSIIDWWKLQNYSPPATISALATDSTMTDYSRRVFYVNQPTLDKENFVQNCPNSRKEQSIVLGCYHSNQNGIFLQKVVDPRLYGVEQVTAAHEMLHAGYDRLSTSERERIDALLEDYYNNQLKDERIIETIDAYKITEPNDIVNEMHSIFATEIPNLPTELEQYYKKYFKDRQQVVAFAQRYQSEFSSREAAVAAADKKIAILKTQKESIEADIDSRQAAIDNKRAELEALRDTENISAFNANVPVYNNMVVSFNFRVRELRAIISEHNALVERRNAIALEENELVKSLSSDVSPINQ